MQHADDIENVIVVLAENLRAAQLAFDNCSIHAINDIRGTATITDFRQTNTVRTSTKKRDLPGVVRMWQCAEPTYRRDLDAEDLYGERDRLRIKWECPVRSVIDVPFSRGTLALNSTRAGAFSAADIVFLQELAAVLSEGFRRLEDLEQLAASEQRYRTLVETPNLGVMLLEPSGRYIYASPKIEELTGYTPEDFRSDWKTGLRLAHPEERRKGMAIFSQTLKGKAIPDQEFRFLHKNGDTAWASGSTFPITDDDGKITAVQVIIQDISSRKRDEESLRQLEAQLHQAQKMEAIGQLTAGIAHNFNNMLMQIMGNVELAMFETSGQLKETLHFALDGCGRAAHIIDQLMIYSRKGETDKKEVDLQPIVGDAVTICRKTFDRKIEISLTDLPQTVFVYGDENQLEQVFLNLCINARDALEEVPEPHLKIDVETPLTHPKKADTESYVCICVSDNGVDIDEKTQQQIFDPFFTTKDVNKGTGLGLSTAYAIVQQHNGWIDVESSPTTGTSSSVYLRTTPGISPPNPEETEVEVAGGTETILVVDDEAGIRDVVSIMLKKKGYTVLAAEDGRQALALFEQRHREIDLVVLDLSMPKLSGEDVLAAMVACDPKMRIAIFTGQEINKTTLKEASAFLRKPIIQHQLLQTVRQLLDN